MVLPGNTAHRPPHPTRFPTVSPHSRRLRRRPGLAQLGGSGSSVVEKYDHENLALRETLKMLLRAVSSLGFGSTGSEHPWEGGNNGSSAAVSSPAATKRAVGRIAEALSAY